MDFNLTSSQKRIREEILELASDLVQPDLTERDKNSVFDRSAWSKIADHGLIKNFAPKEFGGEGWDTITKVVALEAFGEGCSDNGLCLGLSSLVWTILPPILTFGTEDQKSHIIPKLLSGEWLAADGITEEDAGSDAMAMKTSAIKTEKGFIINGSKICIGFAPIADLILLFAKTDENAGPWGVSAFLIDAKTKGIEKSDNREKLGLRTLPMGNLTFQNCSIPSSNLVGSEGAGMSLFNESMEWERSFILATQVGTMARQLQTCVEFVKQRKQFGKTISSYQAVSHRIADMRVRLETCKLLLYKSAWLKDTGASIPLEASITKLSISEAFAASSLDAIRIHGAKGYLSEYEIERDLRDATGGLIYAGTSDIQKNLIARLCGL